jgi:hypothetical protein
MKKNNNPTYASDPFHENILGKNQIGVEDARNDACKAQEPAGRAVKIGRASCRERV